MQKITVAMYEKWSGPGKEESRINSQRVFTVVHGSLIGGMSGERKKVNRFERDFWKY